MRKATKYSGRPVNARTGYSGKQKDRRPTHVGRHSGMEADGYTLHMQAEGYTVHGGRWLHMEAWRHMALKGGKLPHMKADDYTVHMYRKMATHGGRWLHMEGDGYT